MDIRAESSTPWALNRHLTRAQVPPKQADDVGQHAVLRDTCMRGMRVGSALVLRIQACGLLETRGLGA